MSMNKKEKAEMDHAKLMLSMARAIVFRTEPLPKRMAHLGGWNDIIVGWWYNSYTGEVGQGCFTSNSHSRNSSTKTDSQTCGIFFATREAALIVMRHETALGFAKRLAAIDADIEAERSKGAA